MKFQEDPYATYRQLRDEAPVYHHERLDFWVLSRFEDIFTSLRNPAVFSSAQGITFERGEIEKLGLRPRLVRRTLRMSAYGKQFWASCQPDAHDE